MDTPTKICIGCKKDLPLSDFPHVKKQGWVEPRPRPRCTPCHREFTHADYIRSQEERLAKMREHYHTHKDMHKAKQVRYREQHKNDHIEIHGRVILASTFRGWRHALMKKFGITPQQYEDMLVAQKGLCAICGTDTPRKGESIHPCAWSVDHCHTTGRVRGLLCYQCNLALGGFRDDPNLLQQALIYLGQPPSGHAP